MLCQQLLWFEYVTERRALRQIWSEAENLSDSSALLGAPWQESLCYA